MWASECKSGTLSLEILEVVLASQGSGDRGRLVEALKRVGTNLSFSTSLVSGLGKTGESVITTQTK